MEIKVEDYLSKDEMREIVLEEVRGKIKTDSERILGNIPYYICENFIQELVSEDDLELLKTKVKKMLSEDSSIKYHLFKEPVAWDSKKTIKVSSVIQKTIEENLHIVKEKAVKSLENINEDKMTEFLEENLGDLISNVLYKFGSLK